MSERSSEKTISYYYGSHPTEEDLMGEATQHHAATQILRCAQNDTNNSPIRLDGKIHHAFSLALGSPVCSLTSCRIAAKL
ncbi:MAG TPA: hypothetical protein VFA09_09120 [Ktedonobacteraceae bacterium]|nr:hypothetical protein [Ktedonobacteraceae bacterium]